LPLFGGLYGFFYDNFLKGRLLGHSLSPDHLLYQPEKKTFEKALYVFEKVHKIDVRPLSERIESLAKWFKE